jgi:predicted DNA binding protein
MRFATIRYRHPDGWFQSLGAAFAEEDDVTRVAVHSLQLLDDGQALYLYELEGDAHTVRKLLDDTDIATSYQVVESGGSTFAYIHFEPTTTVERLLRTPATYGLVVDGPVTVRGDGSVELTYVGEEGDIKEALTSTPDELTVTIKRVGDYVPDTQQLFADLSSRQQEVLRTAHELGYYEQPRRATQADVAAELNCSPGNVGNILRRIQNTIVNEIINSHFGTEDSETIERSA